MSRVGLNSLLQAWVTFVATNYTAYVTTANTTRKAALVGRTAETFSIGATTYLSWRVVPNGTAKEVQLTQGATQTAADIAADINGSASPGVTASADAYGRLVITSDTDTSSASSYLQMVEATSGDDACSTLGFKTGQTDVRVPIEDPGVDGFVFGEPSLLPSTYWHIRSLDAAPMGVARIDKDMLRFEAMIRVSDTYAFPDATVEAVQTHLDILQDVMHADPSAEATFTYSEVERISHLPQAQELIVVEDQGADKKDRIVATIAEATCRIRANIYQEWTV